MESEIITLQVHSMECPHHIVDVVLLADFRRALRILGLPVNSRFLEKRTFPTRRKSGKLFLDCTTHSPRYAVVISGLCAIIDVRNRTPTAIKIAKPRGRAVLIKIEPVIQLRACNPEDVVKIV
jgi:hypothetical protein